MEITLNNSKPGEKTGDKKPHRVRLSILIEADSPNTARQILADALNSPNGKGALADALITASAETIMTTEWKVW